MEIIQKLITKNRFSRPAESRIGVKGIEVHWVENPKTSAMFNIRYFESLKKQERYTQEEIKRKKIKLKYASTQYIVDLNGDIYQLIPDNEIAYSSGALNYKSGIVEKLGRPPYYNTLSIECTHIDKAGNMTDETYNKLLDLCVFLLNKYKLDTRDLYLHYEITGKKCHKWFVDNPGEWEYFKESVESMLK